MKFLIAMDSFKGSCSSLEAGTAVETGIRRVFPYAQCTVLSIADGGEGTGAALVSALGGTLHWVTVQDPLGRDVQAPFVLLPDGTGVIELASASGLTRLSEAERNPLTTSTYGTGQLIRAALDEGVRKFLIGLGGSATNDGGVGLLAALGMRFMDKHHNHIPPGGLALTHLHSIDPSGFDPRLNETNIIIACDVDNPLLGPRGASAIFGPQKGATPEQVLQLDAALANYHDILQKTTGKEYNNIPGSGAAGGTTVALLAFTSATLSPGIELVLKTLHFEEYLRDTDWVITGEGRIDEQTLHGKVIMGIATYTKKAKKPLLALAGSIVSQTQGLYDLGVTAMFPIAPGPISLQESILRGPELLADTAERCIRMLR